MDNFPVFNMVVGLPGSGKSQFCKNNLTEDSIHISSDDIRKEILGDVNNQDFNGQVFQVMAQRTLNALQNGISVFYDATNLSYKNRKSILSQLPDYVIKKCFIIWTSIEICIERDSKRDRIVGKEVINRMVKSFNAPYFDEGFDNIFIMPTETTQGYISKINMNIPNDNPHHSTKTIQDHCNRCYDEIIKLLDSEDILTKDLKVATFYHDIGKPYCKTFTNTKGEVTETAHYYGHQGVGAWISYALSNSNVHIAWLISRHMDPYLSTKYYRNLPPFLKKQIDVLHVADCAAH